MALFVPFRVLGLVTDGNTPFVTQRRGSETFITTSVGTSWQVRHPSLIIRGIFVMQKGGSSDVWVYY
jgi:hypothetical protein